MYAILMKKEILSNDIILYNPMTVIEGSYDEENDYFIDKFDNEFYKIDDASFAFSELSEGIYFTITEEELLSRYGINTIEEALNYYQDDVFSNFTFAINNGKEKLVVHQVSLSELKELVNNDNLASSYYNGMVSIPKRKLYMLTQLNDEKKLRSFIDYSVKSLKEFERHKTNTEEKDLTKKVNVNINKKENGNNKNIRREIDTE